MADLRNARSFRAMLPVEPYFLRVGDEDMSFDMGHLGHLDIIKRVSRSPAVKGLLEAIVDAKTSGKDTVQVSEGLSGALKLAASAAGGMNVSVGQLASMAIQEAPDLAIELIVDGTKLRDGESKDDFLELVAHQDLDYLAAGLMAFVKANFYRGAAPLLAAARALGMKTPALAAKAPATAASGTPSTSSPSGSDATSAGATG